MNIIFLMVNFLIKKGLKSRFVYFFLKCLFVVKRTFNFKGSSIFLFKKLFLRLLPLVGFISKSVSGKKYLIPIPLTMGKSIKLFLKWFKIVLQNRVEKNIKLKLLAEINDIINKKSKLFKQRKEHYNLVFENRQYLYMLRKHKKK